LLEIGKLRSEISLSGLVQKGEHNMVERNFDLPRTLETISRRKAVCTVSGGLDSTVAAALMAKAGFELQFIFFDWGQKTYDKEAECAIKLASHFNAKLKQVEVPFLKSLPGVSLTQKETLTTAINEYVPNRNSILESQAIGYAEYLRAGIVCVGSTGGDHIAPDNSPQFIDAMQRLIDEGTVLKPPIQIIAPLMSTDKTGAVKLGLELNVPFELTWSCHNDTKIACSHCSNCISRLEAFNKNGMKDPINYKA
jgi:7-cyano-7-deazaguanine synthase